MQLPTWLVGESLSEPEPIDSYLVGLQPPFCVAKVTQKRGWKVMLTLPGNRLNGRLVGERQSELWFCRLEEGAHYWAEQVFQDGPGCYKDTPPEILEREDLVLPRFLLCDDDGVSVSVRSCVFRPSRTFVVHTGEPFMVVEVMSGRQLELVLPRLPMEAWCLNPQMVVAMDDIGAWLQQRPT